MNRGLQAFITDPLATVSCTHILHKEGSSSAYTPHADREGPSSMVTVSGNITGLTSYLLADRLLSGGCLSATLFVSMRFLMLYAGEEEGPTASMMYSQGGTTMGGTGSYGGAGDEAEGEPFIWQCGVSSHVDGVEMMHNTADNAARLRK
jgi:hypothetical protein